MPDFVQRLRSGFRRVFGLDLRSLAAFRISVATVLLYDLVDRSRDLSAHYTEFGVLPVSQAVQEFGAGVWFSVFAHASPYPWAVAGLFLAAIAAALAMGLGYRTRLATAASWYFLASLQVRNDFIAGMGGDEYLRLMLFWALFLPLGARWSLDERRSGARPAGDVVSFGSVALIAQILVMYLATGWLKDGPRWHEGSAVFYALNLLQYEMPLTGLLLEQRWALTPLTFFTVWVERLAPLLLLLPVWVTAARLVAISAFAALHIGLALFLDIGPFPIMALCGWAALIPGAFWDALRPHSQGIGAVPRPLRPLEAVAAVSMAYVLFFQGVQVGFGTDAANRLPSSARLYGKVLRLHQSWKMFAPEPSQTSMWLGVDGRLVDGSHFDPHRRTEAIWELPERIPALSPSFRWRQYGWNALIAHPGAREYLKHHRDFGDYLCRHWNAEHDGGRRLESLRTVVFLADTQAAGEATHELREPRVIFEHECVGASGSVRGRARL